MRKTVDQIREEFVGKGKVQPLRVERTEDGNYELYYRAEKGKVERIKTESRKELDEILIEFGGKNPETVSTPDDFLSLGQWSAKDLLKTGHMIQKIRLSGSRTAWNNQIPVEIPKTCGKRPMLNADREEKRESVTASIRQMAGEKVDFTISFEDPEQLDELIAFINSQPMMSQYKWSVHEMVTLSTATKKYCKWARTTAGDGSKRMVLELRSLNGTHYNNCMYHDLLCAADGLIGGECKKIPNPSKKPSERLVCELYARSQEP